MRLVPLAIIAMHADDLPGVIACRPAIEEGDVDVVTVPDAVGIEAADVIRHAIEDRDDLGG